MSVEWRGGRRALVSARALAFDRFGGTRAFQIFAIYRLQETLRSPPLETKHKKIRMETFHSSLLLNQTHLKERR
jgi:hypothetical protein